MAPSKPLSILKYSPSLCSSCGCSRIVISVAPLSGFIKAISIFCCKLVPVLCPLLWFFPFIILFTIITLLFERFDVLTLGVIGAIGGWSNSPSAFPRYMVAAVARDVPNAHFVWVMVTLGWRVGEGFEAGRLRMLASDGRCSLRLMLTYGYWRILVLIISFGSVVKKNGDSSRNGGGSYSHLR